MIAHCSCRVPPPGWIEATLKPQPQPRPRWRSRRAGPAPCCPPGARVSLVPRQGAERLAAPPRRRRDVAQSLISQTSVASRKRGGAAADATAKTPGLKSRHKRAAHSRRAIFQSLLMIGQFTMNPPGPKLAPPGPVITLLLTRFRSSLRSLWATLVPAATVAALHCAGCTSQRGL